MATRGFGPRTREALALLLLLLLTLFLLVAAGCGEEEASEPGATTQPTTTNLTPDPTTAATTPAGIFWAPSQGTEWQWQLSPPLDVDVEAPVYDIDLFDNSPEVVAALHQRGRRAICYVDVGSYEPWRPDASSFPSSVKGAQMRDWPGEQWLDIRKLSVLGPIVGERLDQCKQKGFDAVEPDNLDGYTNETGFPLSGEDQLAYNKWISEQAHKRGLGVALKNDLDQVEQLESLFDFAVVEQCFEHDECSKLAPFIEANKAVLEVEYEVPLNSFCERARSMRLSSMKKNPSLDAWRQAC